MSGKKNKDEKSEERPVVIRNTTDLQRLKLEKLMKNPDKPILIPERPKGRSMPPVPDFVRNVMGSSAGAGSGEFHVYRHLRRKEYARQKFIQEKSEREKMDDEYHDKLEENKILAEKRTAKKRAKRQKRKMRAKDKGRKKIKKESSSSESSEPDSDEEKIENDKRDNNDTCQKTSNEIIKIDDVANQNEEKKNKEIVIKSGKTGDNNIEANSCNVDKINVYSEET